MSDTGYYRVVDVDFGGYEGDSDIDYFDTLREARKCAAKVVAKDPFAYIEIIKVMAIYKGVKCKH